jgi:hypothetical protein
MNRKLFALQVLTIVAWLVLGYFGGRYHERQRWLQHESEWTALQFQITAGDPIALTPVTPCEPVAPAGVVTDAPTLLTVGDFAAIPVSRDGYVLARCVR